MYNTNNNKMKNENTTLSEQLQYPTERGKIDTSNIQIHDLSLSWRRRDTSIKFGGVNKRIRMPNGYCNFFLLHCDEWDRVVALPRHQFVTGATLLQLVFVLLYL
jgi:hypothetical protein